MRIVFLYTPNIGRSKAVLTKNGGVLTTRVKSVINSGSITGNYGSRTVYAIKVTFVSVSPLSSIGSLPFLIETGEAFVQRRIFSFIGSEKTY